jgi:serine/threonine protein kinase
VALRGIRLRFTWNGTLKDILDRPHLRPRDWNQTRIGIIICDIVMGMRYVHSRGLIHRDLKPANVLLNGHWRGLISDFGVSRLKWAEGPPTQNPGTVWYAAPELLMEDCPQATKTYLFSFGLVLYDILTWFPVFPGHLSLKSIWQASASAGEVWRIHGRISRALLVNESGFSSVIRRHFE